MLKSAVDRNLVLKHLAKVVRRIEEGELAIARERSILAKREGRQQNPEAQRHLKALEESQAALIATRDGIRAKLGLADDPQQS
jgi:exonuclease VII small subunit